MMFALTYPPLQQNMWSSVGGTKQVWAVRSTTEQRNRLGMSYPQQRTPSTTPIQPLEEGIHLGFRECEQEWIYQHNQDCSKFDSIVLLIYILIKDKRTYQYNTKLFYMKNLPMLFHNGSQEVDSYIMLNNICIFLEIMNIDKCMLFVRCYVQKNICQISKYRISSD